MVILGSFFNPRPHFDVGDLRNFLQLFGLGNCHGFFLSLFWVTRERGSRRVCWPGPRVAPWSVNRFCRRSRGIQRRLVAHLRLAIFPLGSVFSWSEQPGARTGPRPIRHSGGAPFWPGVLCGLYPWHFPAPFRAARVACWLCWLIQFLSRFFRVRERLFR